MSALYKLIECKACKLRLTISDFYPQCNTKLTPRPICKKCTIARTVKWRQDNRQRYMEYVREYAKRQDVKERRNDRYRIKAAMRKRSAAAA